MEIHNVFYMTYVLKQQHVFVTEQLYKLVTEIWQNKN